MNQYIKKLRIIDENGIAQDKQIDYNALANLPESLPANGGHANTADSANTATHAAAADEAVHAANADWASHASQAEVAHFDMYGNAFVDTYATKEDLANEVANLVDSAPGALDTLNELAQALGNDPNFATTVLNQLSQKADTAYVNNLFNSIVNGEEVYY